MKRVDAGSPVGGTMWYNVLGICKGVRSVEGRREDSRREDKDSEREKERDRERKER